jgi:hypothetical protein
LLKNIVDDLPSISTSFDAYVFAENEDIIYNIPTPKNSPRDLVPSSISVARTIQGQRSATLLKVLFDSGGTKTFINKRCLPRGATPTLLKNPLHGITAAGRLTATRAVLLRDIVLPEFSRSNKIDDQWAYVFDSDSHYDIIYGRDFLLKIGLDTCFSTKTTNWLDRKIPMKPARFWEDPVAMYSSLSVGGEDVEVEETIECDCFDNMMDAKYAKVDPVEVAKAQTHLSHSQQNDLIKLLSKYETLFDGTLGRYPHCKLHLTLQEKELLLSTTKHFQYHMHIPKFSRKNSNISLKSVYSNRSDQLNGQPLHLLYPKRMVEYVGFLTSEHSILC